MTANPYDDLREAFKVVETADALTRMAIGDLGHAMVSNDATALDHALRSSVEAKVCLTTAWDGVEAAARAWLVERDGERAIVRP